MTAPPKGTRRPGRPDAREQQRLNASQRGAAAVRRAFTEALTRKVLAARVGVNPTTVRRWEAHGLLQPNLVPIMGIPTLVFTEEDVTFATALARIVRARPGELSLRQAADIVHAEAESGSERAGRKGRSQRRPKP